MTTAANKFTFWKAFRRELSVGLVAAGIAVTLAPFIISGASSFVGLFATGSHVELPTELSHFALVLGIVMIAVALVRALLRARTQRVNG